MIEYGVRFQDNSVAHPFNGATQLQRCREMLAQLRLEFPERDHPALVPYAIVYRRTPSEPWVEQLDNEEIRVGDRVIWTGDTFDPHREFKGVVTKLRRGGQQVSIEGPGWGIDAAKARDVRKVKDSRNG